MQRRDNVRSTSLMLAIAKHAEGAGQILTQEELADAADSLLSYFGLLIEADEKLTKNHDEQNQRNSNRPDKA